MPKRPNPDPQLKPLDGGWCVRIAGTRYRLGPDRAAAEQRRRRLVAAWREGTLRPRGDTSAGPGGLSVAEAILSYARRCEQEVSERQLGRVRVAAQELCALAGDLPAAEFDKKLLRRLRADLLARESRRGGKLSRRYVNALIGVIQSAWAWLEGEDELPPGRGIALRAVRPLTRGKGGAERPPVLPADDAAVAATLPHLRPDVADMVRLGRLTGMRPGELCAMRPRDLSRSPAEQIRLHLGDDKSLAVAALKVGGVPVWLYVPASHKTAHKGRPRVVPLAPAAQAILAPYLEGVGPDEYVFSPARSLPGRKGKRAPRPRWHTGPYGQAVGDAAERAGLPRWTPGRLRHSAATVASDVLDLDHASALLGHSKPDMTTNYAMQSIRKAAAAAVAVAG